MKKLILVLAIVLLGIAHTSCTKESLSTNTQTSDTEECCGDGDILPPPPPEGQS